MKEAAAAEDSLLQVVVFAGNRVSYLKVEVMCCKQVVVLVAMIGVNLEIACFECFVLREWVVVYLELV